MIEELFQNDVRQFKKKGNDQREKKMLCLKIK